MRSGFLVGFIAGVAVCVIVANGQIGGIFTLIGALTEGVAAILTAADGAGIIGVLVVIGISLVVGRNWSENRRGRKEADAAWDKRKTFR